MIIRRYIKQLKEQSWAIGFVRGGLDAVMKCASPFEDYRVQNEDMQVDWVKMPKDRWFADPFIFDVTDEEIFLFVEDFPYKTKKGVISLLHIDRKSMEIISRKVLLENHFIYLFPLFYEKMAIFMYIPRVHMVADWICMNITKKRKN